ncbi:MAG TPA: UvrD-helicase domain-containing protein, partial [Patescibacteria group bacterium]|nr:UvrD-helicase domain-containing protein [Patescibacteria group bacterium]
MDLSSLNDKQREAVTAPLGPVLVLAGPGSGKTKTLTHRIAYIIEHRLAKPEQVLALTFTNKAAKEMRSRVAVLLARYKGAADGLTMGTFHAVCARLLRQEIGVLNYGRDFVIFDSDDQQKTLREILEDLRVDTKRLPPSLFSALISRAKNLLQLPAELNLGLESPLRERLAEVYARYQDALYRQNALDFDDLLMLTVKIMESFPKILEKYQKKFAYILVDEYQDTNQAQYTLLRLLAVHRNLFVVGDDAQSIYKFRGSDITNILNFEKDYPEALIIKLEQNYRSTKNILDAAQKVIELNPEQKPKKLWTENPRGEKIILTCEADERAEAEFVARQIIRLAAGQAEEMEYEPQAAETPERGYSILDRFIRAKRLQAQYSKSFGRGLVPQLPKRHDSLKEFCVLYRTHAQSRALEEVFIEASIPYQIVGGLKFYERKEIKDVLAYLRLLLNYRDLVSLKRVLNEPARGLGEKSYSVIRDFILSQGGREQEVPLRDFRAAFAEAKLQPKARAAASAFFELLDTLLEGREQMALDEMLKLAVRQTGYERALRDGSELGESRYENVQELIGVTQKFGQTGWREAAGDFLEEVALISEIDQQDDGKDAVTLMTLHSAKGLEFDNVFFVGLEEGILPHSRSLLSPDELSEEVRLAYVGLTRARKRLYL